MRETVSPTGWVDKYGHPLTEVERSYPDGYLRGRCAICSPPFGDRMVALPSAKVK